MTGNSWIDIRLVTMAAPLMGDPIKTRSVVHLERGNRIVIAGADKPAQAVNAALKQWKDEDQCGNR